MLIIPFIDLKSSLWYNSEGLLVALATSNLASFRLTVAILLAQN